MDKNVPQSYPGLGCLLVLLTLWFVPYGLYIVTLAVMLLLASAAVQWISQALQKLIRSTGS